MDRLTMRQTIIRQMPALNYDQPYSKQRVRGVRFTMTENGPQAVRGILKGLGLSLLLWLAIATTWVMLG